MATTPLKPNPPTSGTANAPKPNVSLAAQPTKLVIVNDDMETAVEGQSSLMVLAKDFQQMIEAAESQHANSLLEVKTDIQKARSTMQTALAQAQEKFEMAGKLATEAAREIDEAFANFGESVDDAMEHLDRLRAIRMKRPKSK